MYSFPNASTSKVNIITTQPTATPKPTPASNDRIPLPVTIPNERHNPGQPNRNRSGWWPAIICLHVSYSEFHYRHCYPGMACFAVEALLVLGLLLASFAAQGAFVISIGNAVLRAAHLTGYPRHGLAAAVGAIGGPIAFTLACVVQNAMVKILTPLCGRIPRPNEEQNSGERDGAPWYWACIQFFSPIAIHTLSGSVGSAILLHRRVDLEGMDVLHGARAGATGDAIIAFSSLLGPFIIFTIFAVLLAPVWIAMIMGAKWVYIKSRETWTEGTHTYSACHCYGTCGGDSEIDGEIESVQRERGSYGTF